VGAQAQRGVTRQYRHRALLVLLISSWAISWPVIKVGVTTVPPIWFACFRYWIAALCLFVLVALRGEASLPPRGDWLVVAVSGVCQMAAYSALTAVALTIVPPGRASVIAFSTPIWVVPLAAWRLREHATPAALLGTLLGVAGALAVAAPSLHIDGSAHVIAYGLLLGAAFSWAVSIVAVRAHRFISGTLALAPWQMLVAACLLLPIALAAEGTPRAIGATAAASLAFVGLVATAFAYWAVVETGRHFSASTLSMALLATPPIGILVSVLALGETIGPSLIAGAALIAAGICLSVRHAKTDVGQ
jgi:drug/metabolite transporter (DMT)-like permease